MESVSRRCMIELALELCGDWKKLGYVLDLLNEVERITQDYRNNVSEQAYRMLQAWKQKKGSMATYQVLGKALRKVSRTDLAEKYCDGGNEGSKTDIPPENLKIEQISKSEVVDIAKHLGRKWIWVGRLLELEDTLLDDIKERNDKQDECSNEMLMSWIKKTSITATYEWLARALLHSAVSMRGVAEKYCIEHRGPQRPQSASYFPPEEDCIQTLNKEMEQLQVCIPKETVSADSFPRNADVEKVNKSQTGSTRPPPVPDDCIRKKLIAILHYKVRSDLIIKLDPPRELGGDYKDLANEMGFDTEKILYFQSLKNPTDTILTSCSSRSVEDLCNKLEAIGRPDARMVIDEWVKSQYCKCTVCRSPQDSS